MLKLSPVPATPYVEQLNIGVGRRTLAISLAVLIAGLMLLMLLSWGSEKPPGNKEEHISVVSLEATRTSEKAPEPDSRKQEQAKQPPPTAEEPRPSEPAEPTPERPAEPMPPPTIPARGDPQPSPASPKSPPRPPGGQVYGPPDNSRTSSSSRDTERVGTAPNGEPLYAAAWYREPSDGELRGYLSTASGPGWGLIACRTVPDYRVEDCVALDEYPNGSQINRAVLAAAWQFRVRPPRLGGQSMVGAWVRIRIDYGVRRR